MTLEQANFRRGTQTQPQGLPSLVSARVLVTPAGATNLVKVQAINEPSAGALYLGEASWPKPAGKETPQAGDECLVAIDEVGRPWIVAWAIPNWGH